MSKCKNVLCLCHCIGGKATCIVSNIILLGALTYGGYYLYKKHCANAAAEEEKKQATEGLVEEVPVEAAPEEKPVEETPVTESS